MNSQQYFLLQPANISATRISADVMTTSSSTTVVNEDKCDLISRVYGATGVKDGLDWLSFDFHQPVPNSLAQPKSRQCAPDDAFWAFKHQEQTSLNGAFDHDYQQYSRTSHMGILDPTYDTFTSRKGHGSLLYKIQNNTAIVMGDPLCSPDDYELLSKEFQGWCQDCRLKVAFMGVGESFIDYAQRSNWVSIRFARERALNPVTNAVLQKKAGKRMISQCRQLLDPGRGGITLHVYIPSISGRDFALESQLQQVYDNWREERNSKQMASPQAFVTVYDLFSHPDITTFVYTRYQNGCINGLSTLRTVTANAGFHADPVIASSSAPRGITDLLIIGCMGLLKRAQISYLSLGYEPLTEIEDSSKQPSLISWLTRTGYRRATDAMHVDGKANFLNKFRPDDSLDYDLHIVIPSRVLRVQQSAALMHVANLRLRSLF
ncbi:hypothetical protein FALBO_14576 [Fusarium albosuccineum]|uniref:Phosphatidylglycerol lysyltransferase C-terminal domain-containing protein n=1 Tax=Fusarium albosuccineum TaxID=1237068 RepID=A0A8H4KYL1_9HYPO|nr:hypothetical protein FALBO_14576 [Fusarium albosuccineum]